MARPRKPKTPFYRFNSSPEIIRLVVMMYVKIPAVPSQCGGPLAERGIEVCYETVRFWWNRFGPMFAAEVRRKGADKLTGPEKRKLLPFPISGGLGDDRPLPVGRGPQCEGRVGRSGASGC
jgi:hypothetical protein